MGVVTSSQLIGLEESIQSFSELTQSLETTYHSLEESVNRLHWQLLQAQQQPALQSCLAQVASANDNLQLDQRLRTEGNRRFDTKASP